MAGKNRPHATSAKRGCFLHADWSGGRDQAAGLWCAAARIARSTRRCLPAAISLTPPSTMRRRNKSARMSLYSSQIQAKNNMQGPGIRDRDGEGSIEGVGASTAYIAKASLWENSGHAYQSVVVALASLGCFRRLSQADGWNIIALQRKRSYQFHQRWGASYFI